MLPVLLDLKFIKIYTFGIFLVLALFWGLFLLWRTVKLTSYKEEDMFDIVFTSLFGALLFSRLVYVLANFSRFGFDILKFILINGYPGLSLYGALIGACVFGYIALRRKKIDVRHAIDYMIAPVFLSMAIGKFGSFLAGVDVGTTTKFPMSVHYLGHNNNRHVTAFYESLLFLIAVYFSYRILLSIRRHFFNEGMNAAFFVLYFSAVTLFLDKLKENHLYFVGFNVNVVFSIIALALSGAYFLYYFRKEIKTYAKRTIKRGAYAVTKKTHRTGEDAA